MIECLENMNVVLPTMPLEKGKFGMWWIAGSATSLLFYLRIRAIYRNSRPVWISFFILWIAISLCPIVMLFNPQPTCKFK